MRKRAAVTTPAAHLCSLWGVIPSSARFLFLRLLLIFRVCFSPLVRLCSGDPALFHQALLHLSSLVCNGDVHVFLHSTHLSFLSSSVVSVCCCLPAIVVFFHLALVLVCLLHSSGFCSFLLGFASFQLVLVTLFARHALFIHVPWHCAFSCTLEGVALSRVCCFLSPCIDAFVQ